MDLVVMQHVLEHVYDPVACLRKVHAVLKPGGRVLGELPNMRSWDAALFGRYWGGGHAPRHMWHFTPATLTRALRGTGFEVAALRPAGRFEDYFLLWLPPLLTLTKAITHFRNVAEHTIVRPREDPGLSRCRTILTGPIEGFCFAPMNFNYQAEHHFYPAIPYFNLPRAQRILSAQKEYADAVDLERGYLRFLLTKAVVRPQAA